MAEKISKTAKKSVGGSEKQIGKRCPSCGDPMVATRVIGPVRAMFWVCQKCSYRCRIRGK